MRPRTRAAALFTVAALLAGYGAFLVRLTAFSVGGSDSSGYMNTARRIVAGTLVSRPRSLVRLGLPDEFAQAFVPLGFVGGPKPGTMAPLYPSGYPAHLGAAGALFGWDRAPYLVTSAAALACLVLFFAFARELGLPVAWSFAGTAIFAAWPVFIGQAIQPMSDVPATAWALASVYSALRARRSGAWWAAAAGAAFGIAVLVRPTNVLMALPLALALPWSAGVLGAFLAGGAPFAAALAAYDVHCYGSPFQSGYGKGGLFTALALRYFGPRMRHYGGWILRTLTPLVPAAWLALLALRRTPARTRALLLLWFGSFFLFYCLYEPYDSFFFVRFLLPGAPGLFLGALLAAREAAATVRGLGRLFALTAAGAGAIVLAAELRSLRETGVLDLARGESTYPAICRWAEIALPRNSVVVSMAASGALEYYTGLAYANWAWLSPESFSDIVRRTRARGVRWFALLFPFEAEEPDRLDAHAPGPWRRIGTLRGVGLYELAP